MTSVAVEAKEKERASVSCMGRATIVESGGAPKDNGGEGLGQDKSLHEQRGGRGTSGIPMVGEPREGGGEEVVLGLGQS